MRNFKQYATLVIVLLLVFIIGGCDVHVPVTYTITVENGIIESEEGSSGSFRKGAVIKLIAVSPDPDLVFINWTSDDEEVSTEPEFELTVQKTAKYIANFGSDGDPNPGDPGFAARTDLYRFYDDFTGETLDETKWGFDEGGGGFGNNEIQYYTRDNIRVEDDKCIMTLKREKKENRDYTSGKFWSRGKFASTYGKIEAKIRLFHQVLDAGYTTGQTQGLWPAFWMMPADSTYGGWPQSGEIDIMEVRGRAPGQMNSTIHRRANSGSNGETWVRMATGKNPDVQYSTSPYADDYLYPNGSTCGDWHVYTVEWEYVNETITFRYYVDDILFFTIGESQWRAYQGSTELAKPKPFDKDFYIIFNLALGGNFDGNRVPSGTNNVIPSNAPLFASDAPPVEYEIDWVVWRDITPRDV